MDVSVTENDVTAVIPWYERGIFNYYNFAELLRLSKPDNALNMYPICKACGEPKSTQLVKNGNLSRHLSVSLENHVIKIYNKYLKIKIKYFSDSTSGIAPKI